jgi:NodT family efflux transporter outer membrane factor (OMF) lipoprotein
MSTPTVQRLLVVLPLGLLCACAGFPRQTAMAPLAGPRDAAAAYSAPARAWPADDWWTVYGDQQLDRLVREALTGSPDLAAAKARLAKADAVVAQKRADLLPRLTGNGDIGVGKLSYNNGIPPLFVPKGWNGIGQLTLNFNYEFDFWGKNRDAVAAATSDSAAAQADLAQARLIIAASVASAYADLTRVWAERDVDVRSAQSRQETFQLVLRRVNDGDANRGELEQARAGPAAARAAVAEDDEQIALLKDRLAALLGRGPDRGLEIERPAGASIPLVGLPTDLSADLVGRRPDLTAARWRALAAAKRVGEAKAQFYPNVNLAAFIGVQSLGLSKLLDAGSSVGQIAPAVSLPIFDAGLLQANLGAARSDYDAAVASYDQTLVQALQEVADAAASQRALALRLKETSDALTANEEAYRIARLRYDGGLANYQTVLIAEDAVLASRRAVADLKARALSLDVQLVRALGGGYHAAPKAS